MDFTEAFENGEIGQMSHEFWYNLDPDQHHPLQVRGCGGTLKSRACRLPKTIFLSCLSFVLMASPETNLIREDDLS